jgi:hypothetical protein
VKQLGVTRPDELDRKIKELERKLAHEER